MKCEYCSFFWRDEFMDHPYCHYSDDVMGAPCTIEGEYNADDDFEYWVEMNGGQVYELQG